MLNNSDQAANALVSAQKLLTRALIETPDNDDCRDLLAATYCDMAYEQLRTRDEAAAIDLFRRANDTWWPIFYGRRMKPSAMHRLALVCQQIGRLASAASPTDEAVTLYTQGAEVCEWIAVGDRSRDSEVTRAESLAALAGLWEQRNESKLAADTWNRAAKIYDELALQYGDDPEYRRRASTFRDRSRRLQEKRDAAKTTPAP
jgi:hypothetical protein